MHDCEAKVLLTASGVMRGNKKIDLKAIADSGLEMCEKQGELATHQLAPQAAVSIRLRICGSQHQTAARSRVSSANSNLHVKQQLASGWGLGFMAASIRQQGEAG